MENDNVYQIAIRTAIRSAPNPISIFPYSMDNIVEYAAKTGRRPHSVKYLRNGIVYPPDDVEKAINLFYRNNVESQNRDHRVATKPKVKGCFKQDLYKLWWLSRDQCNLSGVIGDWNANSILKLTFDRIIPGANGGMSCFSLHCYSYLLTPFIGTYEWKNLQIILVAVNTAKWDYSQEKARTWMSVYKQNVDGVIVID